MTSPINSKGEVISIMEDIANINAGRYPQEQFKEFRHPNGDFARWLHQWQMLEHASGFGRTCFQTVTTPKPWIFKEEPNGELLIAFYHMGYFKNAPQPWPRWKPPASSQPIYGVLLNGLAGECLQRHIFKVRSQCASDIDLMAMMNRHYLLFKETS